jgi:hypothetical protein
MLAQDQPTHENRGATLTGKEGNGGKPGGFPLFVTFRSMSNTNADVRRGSKFGRRDWTRTNDPYHVKVVL